MLDLDIVSKYCILQNNFNTEPKFLILVSVFSREETSSTGTSNRTHIIIAGSIPSRISCATLYKAQPHYKTNDNFWVRI